MTFYRVFRFLDTPKIDEPGHPIFRPPNQQFGRIDNADKYATLYMSDFATGAIAERFSPHLRWSDRLFSKFAAGSGTYMALAEIAMPASLRLCEMDNAGSLLALGLRPSQIVSKTLAITQAWARETFDRNEFDGISWWSDNDSRWTSIGVWNVEPSKIQTRVKKLSVHLPEVREAADIINRECG